MAGTAQSRDGVRLTNLDELLVADLLDYLGGAAHSPLVQAALVHAQFETVHPFTDGNGRVGRALSHTVLTRRGPTPTAVLPISLVLATLSRQDVDGLTAYRYDGDADTPGARRGVAEWITTFARAAARAAEMSAELVASVRGLQADWQQRVAAYRDSQGRRPAPRSDSATARLLELLPEAPVVTARTVQQLLGVSLPAAAAALDELQESGVLGTRVSDRGTRAYLASELLDLVTATERRLASTAFDTRVSPPTRPVPAAVAPEGR